jgi:hypothetical protein
MLATEPSNSYSSSSWAKVALPMGGVLAGALAAVVAFLRNSNAEQVGASEPAVSECDYSTL